MSTTRTAIEDAVALVTGGNRGFGRALVDELLERGAAKVYATSRSPQSQRDARIVPLVLDVADDASVAAAAQAARDVSIVGSGRRRGRRCRGGWSRGRRGPRRRAAETQIETAQEVDRLFALVRQPLRVGPPPLPKGHSSANPRYGSAGRPEHRYELDSGAATH